MPVSDYLAIIPARGGSRGIPGKNLKMLNGAPMLSYTTRAAVESGSFDRIIVDSDDKAIMDIALEQQGVEAPFVRPPELASNTASVIDSVIHLLDRLQDEQNYTPKTLVLLQPTCPLREAQDIQGAIEAYDCAGKPCLLSVSPPQEHPSDFIVNHPDGWAYCLERPDGAQNRQDFNTAWFINGAIYIVDTQWLRENKSFYDLNNCELFVMPPERSFDVDVPFDFELAEGYLRLQHEKQEN